MQRHYTIWNRVTLICAHCSRPFVIPSDQEHRRRCCSRTCAFAYKAACWEERYWLQITRGAPDVCWPWTGSVSAGGYGHIKVAGKTRLSHRVAWELANGPIPDGYCVLHRCDERYVVGDISYRRCCNPAHLFLGTHTENMTDRDAKGRQAQGDRHASRLHPERRPRGANHFATTHPEKLPYGDNHWKSILDEDKVREIFILLNDSNITHREIANEYGVKPAAISKIACGRTWKQVKP